MASVGLIENKTASHRTPPSLSSYNGRAPSVSSKEVCIQDEDTGLSQHKPVTGHTSAHKPSLSKACSLAKQLDGTLGNDVYANKVPLFDTKEIVLEKKLGQGVSGTVYAAHYCDSIAAVKVLQVHDRHHSRCASDELETLATFRDHPHPGILKVMGYGVKPGIGFGARNKPKAPQIWIASQFHRFGTVYDLLNLAVKAGRKAVKSILTTPVLMGLCVDLLNALDHFHSTSGRVHLDLKPENVLISCDGHVVIGDFGWSRTLESLKHCSLYVACTPGYSGPEVQCVAGKNIGQGTDMYSVAVILCQLLMCGSLPDRASKKCIEKAVQRYRVQLKKLLAEGKINASAHALIVKHIRSCATWQYPIPSGVNKHVRRLLRSMLLPTPQDRPTAREAADKLKDIAMREWKGWTPDSVRLNEPEWEQVFTDIRNKT